MAKSIVLGNGKTLVGLDKHGLVNDFYFPRVGEVNNVGYQSHKIGVFVDGNISWLDDGAWEIKTEYESETLVSSIMATHNELGIVLELQDVVHHEKNIFIRHISVHNKFDHQREIKVFCNQQFSINAYHYGNTVIVDKNEDKIFHYKGKTTFLVSGSANGKTFNEYSVGVAGIEGKDGTWKDAEDGVLMKNGVEHGDVDSTIGFTLDIPSHESREVQYWVVVGETQRDVLKLHEFLLQKTPQQLIDTTRSYWQSWLKKLPYDFLNLEPSVVELFQRSLLVMRCHTDEGGGMIASSDSDILHFGKDTYNYVWPRDAAFIALAFDRAGYSSISKKFYTYISDKLTDDGYLLHKYNVDGSLGSSWHPWIKDGDAQLPIQEDETALTLMFLGLHYEHTKDFEFIEDMYDLFIEPAANFMVQYRDEKTGLPKASYDLWEEVRGVSCFSTATVFGALTQAAKFAEMFGKHATAQKYRHAAEEIRSALLRYFYLPEKGYFAKILHYDEEKRQYVPDTSVDMSSTYGVFFSGVLPVDDPRLTSAFKVTYDVLDAAADGIGLARYQGDNYHRTKETGVGNPWFITTFWYVEFLIAQAKNKEDMDKIVTYLNWAADCTEGSSLLSEQFDPQHKKPLSVSPLTWSHAGFVHVVVSYLAKMEELGLCDDCYPVNEK